MNDDDLQLRHLTYALFVQLGRAPAAADVAAESGRSREEVAACWRRMHAEQALVLDQKTGEIVMANPFSAVPTAYRVHAGGRWWYGNCGRVPGATLTVAKLCELAHAWWDDRLSPDWRPHSTEQNQEILDRLGLTLDFWRLPNS